MSQPNEMNGAEPAAPQPTTDEIIDTQLRQAMGFMFRGILVSAPGVPADVITRAIARVTGELIAQAVVGPLVDVLTIRRLCKESMAEGMGRFPPRDAAPGEPVMPKSQEGKRSIILDS